MSGYGMVFTAFNDLMLAAIDEASRRGRRDADIEHLFLGIITSNYPPGHALRRTGVTLIQARQSVDDQHAHQLQLVGVNTGLPEPGRTTAQESTGHQLTRRAQEILNPASSDEITYTSEVLRRLLKEPSGFISEVLLRLQITEEQLLSELEKSAEETSPEILSAERGVLEGKSTIFVPASARQIWDLVSAAERMPEWDQALEAVKPLVDDEETWEAQPREELPNGTPIKTKPNNRRQLIRRVTARKPEMVLWTLTFPDAPKSNVLQRAITLTEVEEGTQLEASVRWIQPTKSLSIFSRIARAAIGRPARPVMRYFVRMQAAEIARGISRRFQ